MNTKIQNVGQVEEFFRYLLDVESVNFHPDEDFKNYICTDGSKAGAPTYTSEEAELRNALMEQSFEVCEKAGVDIYDIGYDLLYSRLKKSLNYVDE